MTREGKVSTKASHEDAIGVDVEGDLDLGNTTRSGSDAGEVKLVEKVVVLRASTFTLVDLVSTPGWLSA